MYICEYRIEYQALINYTTMKKIFTSVIALSLTTFGFSQSLVLFEGGVQVSNDTIEISIIDSTDNANELEIHNVTSSNVTFKVTRTILNPPFNAGNDLYFCTGTSCYPPNTNITYTSPGVSSIPANSTLPSGSGTYGISAHYDVGTATDLWVKYKVYNTAVAGDTAFVTIHYAGTTGIHEIEKNATGTMASAFPNPSNSLVAIKYEMNDHGQKGTISFYDMLGKKVKDVELTEKQGTAKVDVSEFNAGIYFYSFSINNKAIVTKKLIVSSK